MPRGTRVRRKKAGRRVKTQRLRKQHLRTRRTKKSTQGKLTRRHRGGAPEGSVARELQTAVGRPTREGRQFLDWFSGKHPPAIEIAKHLKAEDVVALIKCHPQLWRVRHDILRTLFRESAGSAELALATMPSRYSPELCTRIPRATTKQIVEDLLMAAFQHHKDGIVKSVLDAFPDAMTPSDLFHEACVTNNVGMAKYIATKYQLTPANAKHLRYLLELTAKRGHLDTIRWLVDDFKVPAEVIRRDDDWLLSVSGPRVGQWLMERFNIPTMALRADGDYAMRSAVEEGNLDKARWLADATDITPADVRSDSNEMLQKACEYGHLDVAKFLTERFGLTKEDAQDNGNYAFRTACANGHLDVAKWLVDHFGLTIEDARAHNNYALRKATQKRHQHVVDWLKTRFSGL